MQLIELFMEVPSFLLSFATYKVVYGSSFLVVKLLQFLCLQLSNYSSMEGVLYCKPHFEQLFKETGNFNKNFQSRMSFSFH